MKKASPPPSSSVVGSTPILPSLSRKRKIKPYDELKSTQKRERKKRMREAVNKLEVEIGCPVSEAIPAPSAHPIELFHLSTSDRDRIRSTTSISIPSEQTMIKHKKQLTNTHNTTTSIFSTGAYVSDPLGFINSVVPSSSLICVGGDTGSSQTKIGVTYLSSTNKQSFICLLVYEGGDSWEELNKLKSNKEIKFTGSSSSHPHIFSVLQHLINTRNAFLNGDWLFINIILGLMSASATQPCPICTVCKNKLLDPSTYRSSTSKESVHPTHPPLITIDSHRIVPAPLHVFLGVGNRIIKCFTKLWGKESVESVIKSIKTIHKPGCGGRSDWRDLNGPEIRKWIKKNSVIS
jgi:hypothetical protein